MLNDETARYIYRLYATKQVMESPEQHGFMLAAEDWYAPIPGRGHHPGGQPWKTSPPSLGNRG